MARRPRQDQPGSWHHIINRGLAKRPLFEDKEDIWFYLSRLAREVRRRRIEVHAWCVLTTHFHLLVRSSMDEVSEALRRSQNVYSRFFNRRHKRGGTLVRGRFFSTFVTSFVCRCTSVRSIDNWEAIRMARNATGEWEVSPNGPRRCAQGLVEVALLRTMANRTWE